MNTEKSMNFDVKAGSNAMPNITVLGLGNILLKDEGAGIRVIEYLKAEKSLPSFVRLIDGGTGGMGLIGFIEKADRLIIVDTVFGDGAPGDIYRFTFDSMPHQGKKASSLHDIGISGVFSLLDILNRKRPDTVIVGIEPGRVKYGIGLTLEVESAVPKAAKMVKDEIVTAGA